MVGVDWGLGIEKKMFASHSESQKNVNFDAYFFESV